MILAVPLREAKDILARLESLKEKGYLIGEVVRARDGEGAIQFQ
jgi:hypothetical protein